MNEAAGMSQGTVGAETARMPSREKHWEECDAEQKLDRLRDAVARLCQETTALAGAVQRLAAHSHGDNGLLVPIHMVEAGANYARGALGGGGMYAHDNGIPHNLRTARDRR